eukprot:2106893-Prymnesium_polylepis.2
MGGFWPAGANSTGFGAGTGGFASVHGSPQVKYIHSKTSRQADIRKLQSEPFFHVPIGRPNVTGH